MCDSDKMLNTRVRGSGIQGIHREKQGNTLTPLQSLLASHKSFTPLSHQKLRREQGQVQRSLNRETKALAQEAETRELDCSV